MAGHPAYGEGVHHTEGGGHPLHISQASPTFQRGKNWRRGNVRAAPPQKEEPPRKAVLADQVVRPIREQQAPVQELTPLTREFGESLPTLSLSPQAVNYLRVRQGDKGKLLRLYLAHYLMENTIGNEPTPGDRIEKTLGKEYTIPDNRGFVERLRPEGLIAGIPLLNKLLPKEEVVRPLGSKQAAMATLKKIDKSLKRRAYATDGLTMEQRYQLLGAGEKRVIKQIIREHGLDPLAQVWQAVGNITRQLGPIPAIATGAALGLDFSNQKTEVKEWHLRVVNDAGMKRHELTPVLRTLRKVLPGAHVSRETSRDVRELVEQILKDPRNQHWIDTVRGFRSSMDNPVNDQQLIEDAIRQAIAQQLGSASPPPLALPQAQPARGGRVIRQQLANWMAGQGLVGAAINKLP